VWSPVAAWCLLRVLAELLPEGKHRGEVFDRLYLRSELAEVFHPVGLEGDAGYRAAARVRVLIAPAAAKQGRAKLAWDDPDIAWLTGLHEADGHRYFNQEAHEQMLWWRSLPRLVELAERDSAGRAAATRSAMQTLESENGAAVKAAKAAGYKLDELLPAESDGGAGAAAAATGTEAAGVESESESIIDPSGEMSGGDAEHEKPREVEPK
jgi:hypothetical protein